VPRDAEGVIPDRKMFHSFFIHSMKPNTEEILYYFVVPARDF
jgi:hypothetical protein